MYTIGKSLVLGWTYERTFSLPRGNGKMVDRIERFYLKRTINNLSSKLLLVLSCWRLSKKHGIFCSWCTHLPTNLRRSVCLIFRHDWRTPLPIHYNGKTGRMLPSGTNSPPAQVYCDTPTLVWIYTLLFLRRTLFIISYTLSTTLYPSPQNEQLPLPSKNCSQKDHDKLCPW